MPPELLLLQAVSECFVAHRSQACLLQARETLVECCCLYIGDFDFGARNYQGESIVFVLCVIIEKMQRNNPLPPARPINSLEHPYL
jgi:hypothetical protein